MTIHTLLYSELAADQHGYIELVTPDGNIKYTCAVNEIKFGSWKDVYGWSDAVVVFVGDISHTKTESLYLSEELVK